ncbi:lipopolysaccharide assembly protein LapA domain-containing protein [Psychrosphaera haliotis]|uniref:DUF1049 domain-containing protein n=1 Tax=Psychrosphaera haliotis TaxID=555083 RepID=A0A6N8F8N6_9GAMM|nr:LapA family protein [Psychrosphaera haliotis]MUH71759.1 DUF1049 domain-containing protein [Psychrosphaera haliotis]
MRLISLILLVMTICIALAVGSENAHLVNVNLLFVRLDIPLSLVIMSSIAIGALLTLLYLGFRKVVKKANA